MTAKSKNDFYSELPNEVKEAINKAETELDNGEGIPHEEVMAEIKERYRKQTQENSKTIL